MDYDQVNSVLTRANQEFERQELETFRAYEIFDRLGTDREPTHEELNKIEDDDWTSDQQVEEVSDGVAEAYMSYVADCAMEVAAKSGVSDDDALGFFEAAAEELSNSGALPPMPDVEIAAEVDLSSWLTVAQTSNVVALAIDSAKGQYAKVR